MCPPHLAVFLLSLSVLVKLGASLWLQHHLSRTLDSSDPGKTWWPLPNHQQRRRVRMGFENSIRYELDTEQGAQEWAALVPGGDGIVHLGEHQEAFGISLFHQLRCLDILRREIVAHREPPPPAEGRRLARHCLNYIKQMVLCRGDVHLESFNYASSINLIDQTGDWECRDWEVVYRETRRNQAAHAARQA